MMTWKKGPRQNFKVFLRGEKAHEASGRFTQCWRAQADKGKPDNFAEVCHIGKTSGYHVSTDGDRSAHVMAQAWCHKLQHFFMTWLVSGSAVDMDWAPSMAEYREPASLTGLEAGASRVLALRLGKLRKLRPHS